MEEGRAESVEEGRELSKAWSRKRGLFLRLEAALVRIAVREDAYVGSRFECEN